MWTYCLFQNTFFSSHTSIFSRKCEWHVVPVPGLTFAGSSSPSLTVIVIDSESSSSCPEGALSFLTTFSCKVRSRLGRGAGWTCFMKRSCSAFRAVSHTHTHNKSSIERVKEIKTRVRTASVKYNITFLVLKDYNPRSHLLNNIFISFKF